MFQWFYDMFFARPKIANKEVRETISKEEQIKLIEEWKTIFGDPSSTEVRAGIRRVIDELNARPAMTPQAALEEYIKSITLTKTFEPEHLEVDLKSIKLYYDKEGTLRLEFPGVELPFKLLAQHITITADAISNLPQVTLRFIPHVGLKTVEVVQTHNGERSDVFGNKIYASSGGATLEEGSCCTPNGGRCS